MKSKTKTERRAKILGFNCYYDLETGISRSQGGEFADAMFHLVLLLNWIYRKLAWKLFFILIPLQMVTIPDEGEDVTQMYMYMAELIEKRGGE